MTAVNGRVYLRPPAHSDEREFIELMRASRSFHRPWATAPTEGDRFAAYIADSRRGDFEAYFTFWSGRPDPDGNIYTHYTCKGAQNDPRFCNELFDTLVTKARHVADPAERKNLYDQATEILMREVPSLHLWHRRVFTGYSGKVQGFTPHPDGIISDGEFRRREPR